MPANAGFVIEVDAAATAWLNTHKSQGPHVIRYDVHRCCGGGKICDVHVLEGARREEISNYVPAVLPDGTKIAIDPRAAARLPSRFRLTVRGLGRFKHSTSNSPASSGELSCTTEAWQRGDKSRFWPYDRSLKEVLAEAS